MGVSVFRWTEVRGWEERVGLNPLGSLEPSSLLCPPLPCLGSCPFSHHSAGGEEHLFFHPSPQIGGKWKPTAV